MTEGNVAVGEIRVRRPADRLGERGGGGGIDRIAEPRHPAEQDLADAAPDLLTGAPCAAPIATTIATWIGMMTAVSEPGTWASPPPTVAAAAAAP